MKMYLYVVACCLFVGYGLLACGGDDSVADDLGKENIGDNISDENGENIEKEPRILSLTPIDSLNRGEAPVNSHAGITTRSSLKMNFRTYNESGESGIGNSKPNYPRIKKMRDGAYIMFTHNNQIGSNCKYAISSDLKKWVARGTLFAQYDITDSKGNSNSRRYSNCDALVLSNGDILAVASFRANNGYRDLPKDAGIELRRSYDNGITWSHPLTIYQGVNWEPYLLELPSGEIQCYFTDSSRTGTEGMDTGTAMVVSTDGGWTWSPAIGEEPYYVIRIKWEKDGNTYFNHQMPSVIKLNNSNELVGAVETHHTDDKYYVSLVYSGNDGKWDELTAEQEGPSDSDNLSFGGCAPYIVQFPSGETILSYNTSSKFYIKIGDSSGRNFGNAYRPFPGSGYWGTLHLSGSHELIGAMPNTSNNTVMLARFFLNHQIESVQRSVDVDGDNGEWMNTDHALFVGEKSQAQGTLRCACDNNNVYFLIEVRDNNVTNADYATLQIAPITDNDKLITGSYQIKVSSIGLKSVENYNAGWNTATMKPTVATMSFDKDNTAFSDNYGYAVEIAIPRSSLTIKNGKILVNFSIFDSQQGEEDAICDVSSTNTERWIPISGL